MVSVVTKETPGLFSPSLLPIIGSGLHHIEAFSRSLPTEEAFDGILAHLTNNIDLNEQH